MHSPSRIVAGICYAFLVICVCHGQLAKQDPDATKPGILVELFTSEGCSSCPPADELLRKLDSQVMSGQQIVVLGEHVDYWDRTGWRDRFSSRDSTERQGEYARRFQTSGPYTPQIVIDGTQEFVGNDSRRLHAALQEALPQSKTPVRIVIGDLGVNEVVAKLEVGPLPHERKHADLYVAIADNEDETQVGGGENSGKRLRHVAVLRSLQKVGKLSTEGAQKEVRLHLPKTQKPGNLRLVVFVQEPNNGTVLGSSMKLLSQAIR